VRRRPARYDWRRSDGERSKLEHKLQIACSLVVAGLIAWWAAPDLEPTETKSGAIEIAHIEPLPRAAREPARPAPAPAPAPEPMIAESQPEMEPAVEEPAIEAVAGEPPESFTATLQAEPEERDLPIAESEPIEPEPEPIEPEPIEPEPIAEALEPEPAPRPIEPASIEPEVAEPELPEPIADEPDPLVADAAPPEPEPLEPELPTTPGSDAPSITAEPPLTRVDEPLADPAPRDEPQTVAREAAAPPPEPPAVARLAPSSDNALPALQTPPPRAAARDTQPERARAARPRRPRIEPLDDVALAIGRYRLEEGRYPHQRASYARIGFEAYRDAMLALGGAFFLFDTRSDRVLAQVNPYTLEMRAVDTPASHLSRWPRDVTRHLGAALDAPNARRDFGRATRVVLLPPADIDAALVGGLDRALQRMGMNIERVTQVLLTYELTDAGLECEVSKLALRDGTEKPVSLRLSLSGPIPKRRGGRS